MSEGKIRRLFHRETFHRNRVPKVWLLTLVLSLIGIGYTIAGVTYSGSLTLYQFLGLLAHVALAGVATTIVWFAIEQGSRTVIKNCTFTSTGEGTGLVLHEGHYAQ